MNILKNIYQLLFIFNYNVMSCSEMGIKILIKLINRSLLISLVISWCSPLAERQETWMMSEVSYCTFTYCLKTSAAMLISSTLCTISLQYAARRFLRRCKSSSRPSPHSLSLTAQTDTERERDRLKQRCRFNKRAV